MFTNPFNGIESNSSRALLIKALTCLGIHSMELKDKYIELSEIQVSRFENPFNGIERFT